ncbi:hypothetical protein MRY87_12985 [bacterium]|nr:hypothetical protein [bacterium]
MRLFGWFSGRVQPLSIVLIVLLCIGEAAAQVPPGLSSNAYLGDSDLSGVFTGTNALYVNQRGSNAYRDSGVSGITNFKRVVVTEPSTLAAVTGNAVIFSALGGATAADVARYRFRVTVDPFDSQAVFPDPFTGSLHTVDFSVDQVVDIGHPSYSTFFNSFDLLLKPASGTGPILQPGEYYVAAYAWLQTDFVWTELNAANGQSDVFTGVQTGVLRPLIGTRSFPVGGPRFQTGVLAFDIWLEPLDANDGCDSTNSGAIQYVTTDPKPVTTLFGDYSNVEIHEEAEEMCVCGAQSCDWSETGNTRYTVFDTDFSCLVVTQGYAVNVVDPNPECGIIGANSTTAEYVDFNAGIALLRRERCDNVAYNGYSLLDGTLITVGIYNPSPLCTP